MFFVCKCFRFMSFDIDPPVIGLFSFNWEISGSTVKNIFVGSDRVIETSQLEIFRTLQAVPSCRSLCEHTQPFPDEWSILHYLYPCKKYPGCTPKTCLFENYVSPLNKSEDLVMGFNFRIFIMEILRNSNKNVVLSYRKQQCKQGRA